MSILQEYEDIRRQLGEEEWNTIDTFLSENKQYQLSDVLYKEKVWKIYEDWKRGSSNMKNNRKKNIKSNRKVGRRSVKAAESYGWIVDENEAWEAYEFACDYFGKEELDDQIVSSLSVDELASSLAFIFRMNDFREWEERNGGSDDEDDEEVELELIDAGEEFTDVDDVIAYVKANATSLTDDDLEAAQDYLLDEYNIYKRSDYLNTTDTFKQLDSILDIIDAEQERRANMNDLDGRTIGESIRAKGRKSIKSSKRNTRRPVMAARITTDFSNFKPWSGAVDTWNELEKWDKIDLLEQILDDTYYNEEAGEAVMSETELNDLLWFEPETVYEWVGLYYNDETGEVSDEPFDDDYDEDDEDEDIEESTKVRGKKSVKANRKNRVMAANNGNASVSKIKKFIEDSVNNLQTTDYTNCRLVLDDDLCLYVGYSSGFDTEDGYAICAKIAERNDADWADFDYLNMPWNTYNDNDGSTGVFEGDVYDTDTEITPGEDYTQDAQWLADSYVEIRNLLDEGKLTF